MSRTFYSVLALFLVLLVQSVVIAADAADSGDANVYQRLLDAKSPAIITIKTVLKVKAGSNEQEMESEASGVMIDPKGLVLCSNSRLGGAYGLMRRMLGSGASAMSITPTDIKVIVGDAAEGLDAKFIARDTELDLAWIQIKEPGDKTFAHVDLTRSVTPKVGQALLSVYRTSKNFDRTSVIVENRIRGAVKKPREIYLAGDLSAGLGLPAFTKDGIVVGISILQMPDGDDEDSGAQRMNRLANSHEYSGALLPVAEVIKATARAKESAASQPASDASSDDSTTQPAKPGKKADAKEKATEEK